MYPSVAELSAVIDTAPWSASVTGSQKVSNPPTLNLFISHICLARGDGMKFDTRWRGAFLQAAKTGVVEYTLELTSPKGTPFVRSFRYSKLREIHKVNPHISNFCAKSPCESPRAHGVAVAALRLSVGDTRWGGTRRRLGARVCLRSVGSAVCDKC